MTKHRLSSQDRRFRRDFEAGRCSPESFDHRAHVRLAYVYLAERDVDTALALIREALLGFLRHHGIDPSKYHETMTRAWVLAVRHFLEMSPEAESADQFIDHNPTLLDSRIMLTHYSAELLFSPQARAEFVDPDLDEIPRYDP
jgi:hypothetical protein